MIFYWIDILRTLDMFLFIVAFFAFFGLGLVLIEYYNGELEWAEDIKIITLTLCFVLSVSILGQIFIPNEKTMYKMLIASYVTEDSYDYAKEEMTELIDYIADKFNGEGDE